MELFFEVLKAALLGIVQGITEWLPVSSTGHMILLDEILSLKVSAEFMEMFRVVIQLGSILAVLVLYFPRLSPVLTKKSPEEKKKCLSLWGKIILAVIPAGVAGVLLDDWLDAHLYNYITVAVTLIVYGVAFLVIERMQKNKTPLYAEADDIDAKTAIKIGCFQMLSLIPGTSRSGSTILGGMLSGVSRPAGAEFSFFLALPVMLGASALKLLKFGFSFTGEELLILAVGTAVAFFVSLVAIRFLVAFVRRHSFAVFGWYRIALGAIVLGVNLIFG
ncbi:MAG: undecaprenyl-diphosphate phosphatase [Ruminococcaceae bacterium]|nr:undecaprenyl-diphosphate phosphatase [Oscillospiraceae bacterium]